MWLSTPEVLFKIVRSKVTTLSQPKAFVKVCVAEALLAVYVLPSIQSNDESQKTCVSIETLLLTVKSKVTTLSHPAAFVSVCVAE